MSNKINYGEIKLNKSYTDKKNHDITLNKLLIMKKVSKETCRNCVDEIVKEDHNSNKNIDRFDLIFVCLVVLDKEAKNIIKIFGAGQNDKS
ncbi:hypothetical protein BpHYR1_051956 [Brachionus plicatilis]|uniref:Uncharacterized protein n=1 Tax=Brachionus plicatilis TaxID=10195 RepID=A0A3M7SGN0_BRAPC|nr:hypothetical protein BpHYR1_051956 [Brachionus plicatilis]